MELELQNHHWVTNHIKSVLFHAFMQKEEVKQISKKLKRDLEEGKLSPFLAGRKLRKVIIESQ